GTIMPDRITISGLVIVLMPWSVSIDTTEMLTSVVTAADRRVTAAIERANSARASRLSGARSDQSPRPVSGNAAAVTTTRGTARNSVAAVRHAMARANQ